MNPILESWMIMINDETAINKIAIPGSHDAATAGVIWAAQTQDKSIKEQLMLGARYFDLRVHKKGDQYLIFHSIIDGIEFKRVLDDIEEFIVEHPTEFLVLDFQHFKGDSQDDVAKMLLERLGSVLVKNNSGKDDVQFIRSLKLKDVRGKCLVFWGDESASKTNYTFLRNDNECHRENACLDSYYISKLHKADAKTLIEKGHPVYFERLANKEKESTDGIFVLQCQFTDGACVRGPRSRERKFGQAMTDYVKSLKTHNQLEGINVIMRDFLDTEKCTDIINLNYSKDIMKMEM